MISPRKALKILGRRPAKRLGQHFLIHQATAEKIAAAIRPEPGDVVVEIGAGLGALTWPLSRSGARVVAVEIGRWSFPRLFEDLLSGRGDCNSQEALSPFTTKLTSSGHSTWSKLAGGTAR